MSSKPSDAFVRAARRASEQPFFMASIFGAYQAANALDDQGLAQLLGCAINVIPHLALCRRPAQEPAAFAADVDHLAKRFQIDGSQLAAIVRQVDALQALRQHLSSAIQSPSMLRAARDRDEAETHDHDEERGDG